MFGECERWTMLMAGILDGVVKSVGWILIIGESNHHIPVQGPEYRSVEATLTAGYGLFVSVRAKGVMSFPCLTERALFVSSSFSEMAAMMKTVNEGM